LTVANADTGVITQDLTQPFTVFMKQSHFSETNDLLTAEQIHVALIPKFHYPVHNCTPLARFRATHTLVLWAHFNIVFSSTPTFPK